MIGDKRHGKLSDLLQTKFETESQGRITPCLSSVKILTTEPLVAAVRAKVGQLTTEMNRFALIASRKLDFFELSGRSGEWSGAMLRASS